MLLKRKLNAYFRIRQSVIDTLIDSYVSKRNDYSNNNANQDTSVSIKSNEPSESADAIQNILVLGYMV